MKYLIAVLFFCAAGTAFAQEEKDEQRPVAEFRYEYDFRYPRVLSRDNITNTSLFPLEAMHLGLADAFDAMGKEKYGLRLAGFAALAVPLYRFERDHLIAGHENGHMRELSRLGFGDFVLIDDEAGRRHQTSTLFETYWHVDSRAFVGDGWASTMSDDDWDRFFANPKFVAHEREFLTLFDAGGLNQEQYTLERIADRVLEGKASVFDLFPWAIELTATQRYATGVPNSDIDDYISYEGALGVRTSRSHVKDVQWLKYASGSSLMMVYELCDFIRSGDTRVSPPPGLAIGNAKVSMPEFASYLTTEGVTVKTRLPITAVIGGQGIRTDIVYQTSIDSNCHEFGLHERFLMDPLRQHYAVYYNPSNGGYWMEGGCGIAPWKWLELGVTGHYADDFTFERELRGATYSFLKDKEWSIQGYVKVEFQF